MTVGSYLRGLREKKGISLRRLASKAGVDPAHLSRIEAGTANPSEQLVKRLASILGCAVDDLMLKTGRLPQRLRKAMGQVDVNPADVMREFVNSCVAEPKPEYDDQPQPRRGRKLRSSPMSKDVATLQTTSETYFEACDNSGRETSVAEIKTGARKVDPRNRLNALTSTEWLPETVSVWTQRGLGAGHADAQIERQHPAPFSFTDVARLVRFFTKPGECVLDPFVGVGSTLKACALEGRQGIGIELNPEYVALTRERLKREVRTSNLKSVKQKIMKGDSRKVLGKFDAESVDFVVTSPPYWNILHKEDHKARRERKAHGLDTRYGDDPRDLGNVSSYPEFLEILGNIFGQCGRILKKKKYMALVVSDFRDKSRFIMFHADLVRILGSHKLGLRGIKILYQRHKKVFPYGYPYAYVPNIHHQYILILQNER